MNQQVCPNCNTPLNADGSCPNCANTGADAAAPAQEQEAVGVYQPDAEQVYPALDQQGYQTPDQGYPAQDQQGYQVPDQGYPAQDQQGYANYPQQGYQTPDQGYPAQGYQTPDQGYPAQGYQVPDQGYPMQDQQGYANYPQQGYPNMNQGYPQQDQQGYSNYPQQGYPAQGGYQPAPQGAPDSNAQFGSSNKKISTKKLLAIIIPAVALLLVAVLFFTLILPAIQKAPADDGTFSVGETWTVDDQWSLTIKGIYELTDRYTEYGYNSDVPDPEAVYLIDYEYTNINYYNDEETGNKDVNTSSDSTKLLFYIDPSDITDENGEEAFRYDYSDFVQDGDGAGVGETVHTVATFGVDHRGKLTLNLDKTTDSEHNNKLHKAQITLDTSTAEATESSKLKYEVLDNAVELKIGEKWTVDDQWSLTINSIKKTSERSKYSKVDYNVAEVYIIDYTYTNINYNSDYGDGLYMFFSTYATDTAGVECEYYGLTGYDSADYIQPGETCHCQDAIAVSKEGGFTVDALEVTDSAHGTEVYYCGFTYTD